MRIRSLAICLGLLVLVSAPSFAQIGHVYSDTFSRTTLGTTEDSSLTPWIIKNDAPMVQGGQLVLRQGSQDRVMLGNVLVQDFEATFTMTLGPSLDPGWWGGGFHYRSLDDTGYYGSGGYLLHFITNWGGGSSNPGTILGWSPWTGHYAGTTTGLDFTQPHKVVIRVVGTSHKVWIDGTLREDRTVNAYAGPGPITFATYGLGTRIDDFTLLVIPEPASLTVLLGGVGSLLALRRKARG